MLEMMIDVYHRVLLLFYAFLSYLYSLYKFVIHVATGKSEIARICASSNVNLNYVFHLEDSFSRSKDDIIRNYMVCLIPETSTKVVDHICQVKKLNTSEIELYKPLLLGAILKLVSYSKLLDDMENLRKMRYDLADLTLEKELLDMWSCLKPDVALVGRFTKQWEEIGFQGKDPSTDFRGMGLLGFKNILYFTRHYSALARQNLAASNHLTKGYSFAIVGINLTDLLYNQMKQDYWKPMFLCEMGRDILLDNGEASMDNVHEIFCQLFNEFHEFWFDEDRNIMDFGKHRENFKQMYETKYRLSPSTFSILSKNVKIATTR